MNVSILGRKKNKNKNKNKNEEIKSWKPTGISHIDNFIIKKSYTFPLPLFDLFDIPEFVGYATLDF